MSEYSDKLKDPRWKSLNTQIKKAAGNKCRVCGGNNPYLTVHHGYYKHGKEPWEYEHETLWCLCAGCHDKHQNELISIKRHLGSLNPREYLAILEKIDATLFHEWYGVTPEEAGEIVQEIKAQESTLFSD